MITLAGVTLADIIILLVLASIVGLALFYVIRKKKSGGCSGCPEGAECPHKNNSNKNDCCH